MKSLQLCTVLVVFCLVGAVISEQVILSRHKRFIKLNSQAPVQVAAYVTLPISVTFPKVSGRSIDLAQQERMSFESLDPESFDEPSHLKQLRKMDAYFAYLSIPEDVCQQRILCEMASQPDQYSPVYEVFHKQCQDPPVKQTPLSRYFRYWKAMEIGQDVASHDITTNGTWNSCAEVYKACPFDGSQIFHTRLLQALQFVIRYLKVQLKDDA